MRFALLIGINYKGTDSELNGCINDVLKMKEILMTHFGFLESNIVILTDETKLKPTGQNIINEITNLILKTFAQPDSQIWVHYSGHGASIQDQNSDEADGMDEVIIPLDFQTKGIISDDKLHSLFKHLPSKTQCICFFDCCHSGTILDLKYKFKWCGAMTTSFISVLDKNNYEINCNELLKQLRDDLVVNSFTQIPQMTSSFHITTETVFCSKGKKCLIKSN